MRGIKAISFYNHYYISDEKSDLFIKIDITNKKMQYITKIQYSIIDLLAEIYGDVKEL